MNLFTFVLDYKGGVYISQVWAMDYTEAPSKWANSLNIKKIHDLGPKNKEHLMKNLINELYVPQPLEGLTNVWCVAITLNGHLALVNFMATNGTAQVF
jgi:hypothetical protein